jgi:hypothetical protein
MHNVSFFFWPLCCLSFDLRILITPLVSSNSSHPSHDGDHQTFKTAIKQQTIILNLNVYLILLEDVNSFTFIEYYF